MGQKSPEERIENFLRFGSKLGLERMRVLMHKLGDPQDDLSVIHVAGTNGKGSTARYIYESLIEAGYKAGIYTSPYIEKFNERIEADRKIISDDDLNECLDEVFAKVTEMTQEGMDSPTEFEVITAAAFLWFRRIGCEAVVLEVGLGGRGDSTNIVKAPVICVIASISYDHMDRLGNTIPEIASEKAGIIKASCPVVVSTEREDALEVFRSKASSVGAPLYDARRIATCDIKELRPDGATFDYSAESMSVCMKDVQISMGGRHQVTNAAEAITALLVQDKFVVSEEAIRRGLARAKQPCRFEVLYKPESDYHPWVILDGAHNKDAAVKLRETINQFFPKASVLLVCGMLRDKDVDGVLEEFTEIGNDFIATEPDIDRKLGAYDLAKKIHERGKMVYEIPKPVDAAALAMSLAKGYDMVLFTGSFYLIGKLRTLLRERYLAAGDICFDRPEEDDGLSFDDDED